MGVLIHLTSPASAGPDAARVDYSVGRSLTASDFGRQAKYVDARLLGLTPANTGVISGLGVSPARYDNLAAQASIAGPAVGPGGHPSLTVEPGVSPPLLAPASLAAHVPPGPIPPVLAPPSPPSFTVAPGAGIGADGRLVRLTAPLTFAWADLLAATTPAGTIPDGVYLLLLQTQQFDGVEGPPPDASADAGGDPLLDIRQDSFVELSLSASIGTLPATLTHDSVALALNLLIGGLSPQSLATAVGAGVPIALVMIRNNQLLLLSQAAGRVAAAANPLGALLLAQTREALGMALSDLGANPTAAAWGSMTQRFAFLPGACELPLSMLNAPSSFAPSCPFLPIGVAVYFQIIPSSQATNLLTQALGRPAIDLRSGDAPAVTLSLAVPDASWTPDLIDEPFGDPILPADLHFAYARARVAQAAWLGDWVALYGGMTATPTNFPQQVAFLVGADAAAQNLSYLLTIGAIQTQGLVDAAAAASTSPTAFLSMITGWISALPAAGQTATQAAATAASGAASAAYAAAATSFTASTPGPPSASALTAALTQWPTAAVPATNAANAVGASAASIAAAAAGAAAQAAFGSSAASTSVSAAMASAATAAIAAAYPATATPAAQAGAAAAAAAPAAVPAAPTPPAAASQLLANLGYQVLASDAEPGQPNVLPVSSDNVLSSAAIYPADWTFAAWTSLLSTNPALLQPLIDAGVISANPATQSTELSTFRALVSASAATIDDTTPGALLQLATAQLFYAVLGRVARAQEYFLDAHSRLIALQRQHLDMMSTYVSAVAGGVPSDGTGLSLTKIIPFFTFGPTPTPTATPSLAATPAPAPPPAPVPAGLSGTTGHFPLATNALPAVRKGAVANMAFGGASASKTEASLVLNAPIETQILSTPVISKIGTLFGNQTDIAKTVAAQTSALSQAPQFAYGPVTYGMAAHITSGSTLFQSAQSGLAGLRALMSKSPISVAATALAPLRPANASDEAGNYDGVIQITRCLLSDIAQVENNAIKIEASYTMLRDRLQSLETLISQLSTTVAAARDTLRAAQAASAKAAGDYAAAQTLVAEEAARENAALQSRNQAIAAATGLFMVRQLQTAIARDPPATLSLTADTPADLAPGCLADHPGPPASLTPFLDLLLETPLGNWKSLAGGWTELPDVSGLQRLSGLRAVRLANFAPSTDFGGGAAAPDLANLAASARSAIDPVLRSTFTLGSSLAANQRAAFRVFSLPDLITLPANILRTNAEALRARMESATGCLYETLAGLPPSARFAWATLARAGTLPALSFLQWPLPDAPTAATTTALRQLSALVGWMAAQLTDGASAASQTALSSLVSAAVIAAAYGDPNEAVSGAVISAGGVPRPGLPIRITLNRPLPIGSMLNMLDGNQNIVGALRVQDHDAYGVSATVVTSFATTAPDSTWTVASPGRRSPWLAS
ncbi:MAG: hypothetical protein JO312_26055 [Hyphomicrobiales bacterium]|nr:hypothetical protein [Hyphomicrobiales bacterium]